MKTLLKFAFLLFPVCSFSQTKLYNSILKDPSQKVLYIGVDNILKIDASKSKDNYELAVNGEKISAIKKNEFKVVAGNLNNVVIEVFKNNKLISTETFTVKRLPDDIIENNSTNLKVILQQKAN